jgi:tRNA(fMet)-specific endonuclease VapC
MNAPPSQKYGTIGLNNEPTSTTSSASTPIKNSTLASQILRIAIFALSFFSDWRVAPFDEAAATMFDELQAKKVNIGSSDLKIAATAIVNDAILLTANTIDFGKVPGLRFESWL